VEVRVTALFVHIEVTLRMKRDPLVRAPIAVNPQCDLLSHRPGRHPNRCLFAEQGRDASLQPFRECALAVPVRVFA
jgi:hypothetical protein